MATHSSVLAWRIPGTGEPGGLTSMGLQSQTHCSDLPYLTSILNKNWKNKKKICVLSFQYFITSGLIKRPHITSLPAWIPYPIQDIQSQADFPDLHKVKEESEKVGLKLNIQKRKIMASCPITSWQIDGETMSDFNFWGSKITADGDCSHEIKRHLLLGST